jgi:hypothetical protein
LVVTLFFKLYITIRFLEVNANLICYLNKTF